MFYKTNVYLLVTKTKHRKMDTVFFSSIFYVKTNGVAKCVPFQFNFKEQESGIKSERA